MVIMKIFWLTCLLFVIETIRYGKCQQYQPTPYDQNASSLPLPYQPPYNPPPQPYPFNYPMPPPNQPYMNPYYAQQAQQGRGVYQYPTMGYYGGYGPLGMVPPQPGMGYPLQGPGQQNVNNGKVEILDVSPEYQRQLLGWPAVEGGSSASGQGAVVPKPKYTVNIDTKTTNNTVIPANLSKPIISEKRFITSIRRTFVYDSSKPENIKPINIHIVNGQQVTTTPPPTTTINENVEGITSWYQDNEV